MNNPDQLLKELFELIEARKSEDINNSYTKALFEQGRARIAQKVGEEAVETVIAAMKDDKQEMVNEVSDLLFHLFVLMSDAEVSLDDVIIELQKRRMSKDHDNERDQKE